MTAMSRHAILIGGCGVESEMWMRYGLELAHECGATPVVLPCGIHADISPISFEKREECFLLTQFPTSEVELQHLIHASNEGKMDLLLSRGVPEHGLREIVVASGGGTRALKAIDLAGRLGAKWNLPIRVLRVIRPLKQLPIDSFEWTQYLEEIRDAMTLQCKLQGVDASIHLAIGESVSETISRHISPNDFLLLGGPSDWRILQHPEGTIPYEILAAVSNPAILLIPAWTKEICLSEVYWEDTIRLNLFPKDKSQAISLLVNALVEEQQIPGHLAAIAKEAAETRERIQTTAVGCGVAVPHAALDGFTSIVGCLGIFPDGVRFEQRNNTRVHFAFLLITPRDDYGQYLVILSQLARLMHKESNRNALLKCITPKSASELIVCSGNTMEPC